MGGRWSRSRAVMVEIREGDGFSVFWDGDGVQPGMRMILWCRWWRQVKDDCRGGGTLGGRSRGWGRSNK